MPGLTRSLQTEEGGSTNPLSCAAVKRRPRGFVFLMCVRAVSEESGRHNRPAHTRFFNVCDVCVCSAVVVIPSAFSIFAERGGVGLTQNTQGSFISFKTDLRLRLLDSCMRGK